jgi:hypothetical protein
VNPNLGVSYEVWGSTASSVRDSLDFCQAKAELIIHTSILNELGGGDFKGLGRTFRFMFFYIRSPLSSITILNFERPLTPFTLPSLSPPFFFLFLFFRFRRGDEATPPA